MREILFSVILALSIQSSAFAKEALNRAPANIDCSDIIEGFDKQDEILKSLPQDAGLVSQIVQVRSQLVKNGQLESAIKVTSKMEKFRAEFLPYLKIDTYREALVRSMEAELRIRSSLLANTFKTTRGPPPPAPKYDLVIVGTGVHGVISMQAALAKNPNLRILMIDAGDTAGGTFRYAGDSFSINSSNRPSSSENLPLPGQGNINELPGLPVQVSDLSPSKYPSAGDLGAALVTGLYAGVTRYPNVDLLFDSQVLNISNLGVQNGSTQFQLSVKNPGIASRIRPTAEKVIISTGLGKPQLPKGVADAIKADPTLVETSDISKKLPKIMTFEDVMRVIAQSNNPKQYFAGKKIAVVGTGDSANVFIEFLLGYAQRNGYGLSDGQTALVDKILWVGQDKTTCIDFIATIRSRYAQIGTGYRSSDPNGDAIIEATGVRLSGVERVPNSSKVSLSSESGAIEGGKVDHVILATGFDRGLRKILKGLFPEQVLTPEVLASDQAFLDAFFNYLTLKTTTSNGVETRVARYAGRVDSSGRRIQNDPGLLIVGPAAGKLPQDNELVGIIQNSVSIFNNAPRTYAASAYTTGMITSPGIRTFEANRNLIQPSSQPRVYRVINLSETRTLGASSDTYISSTLKKVLEKSDDSLLGLKSIQLTFVSSGTDVLVTSREALNLNNLVETLSDTRDFFNVLKPILSTTKTQLVVEVPVVDGAVQANKLEVRYETEGNVRRREDATFANSTIDLRGIE